HNLNKVQTQYLACHTKQGNERQDSRNGNQEIKNEGQKKENGAYSENQEVAKVTPIGQAREIALQQYLEKVDISAEDKATPSFKHTFKEGEVVEQVHTIAEKSIHPLEVSLDTPLLTNTPEVVAPKLKKWTPPGYIRLANKSIIKESKVVETPLKSKQSDEGVIDGASSILEVDNITEEQKV
ncbi:MAG: hypothetical protein ACRCVU_11960, partial [Flavobacterium sp.]